MKFEKTFFVLLISLSLFRIGFGQMPSESRKIDEFGKIINDDLQGRVVNFMSILKRNNSHGYIVLNGTKETRLAMYVNERRIHGCLSMMKYDTANLSFIFTEDNDEILGQFWEIPKDAKKPTFKEVPHDYKLANFSEARFLRMLSLNDDFCPLNFDMEFFSRFLNANPDIVGIIGIEEKNYLKFRKERYKYFQELSKVYKVSSKQIEFKRNKYTGLSNAEFGLRRSRKIRRKEDKCSTTNILLMI